MTLQQLRCFARTAEHGSFNGAARDLRLSQPAVSDQVRRLEAELGCALVRRKGRGLSLTSEGRTFLAHALRVLEASEDARGSVGRGTRGQGAALSFGITRNAPHYPVDELIAAFAEHQPDVRLRLPGHNSADIAEAVREGQLDAALIIAPVDPQGLDLRPLFRDEILFVSRDGDRTRRPVGIEHLASAPLILYDASLGFRDPTRRQLATRAQRAGVVLKAQYDVESVEIAMRLAARGLGDSIAARAVTQSRWFPSSLHLTGFSQPLYDHLTLITRAGPQWTGPMRRLLDEVESWATEMRTRLEQNSPHWDGG